MKRRTVFAVALAGFAGFLYWQDQEKKPAPEPTPGALKLTPLFIGATAAEDRESLGVLCRELADCIERDGLQADPRLMSGVAFDDLRRAACECYTRGQSIGARQPKVKEAVQGFLESELGTSGGLVTKEKRAAWVASFREIAGACNVQP